MLNLNGFVRNQVEGLERGNKDWNFNVESLAKDKIGSNLLNFRLV